MCCPGALEEPLPFQKPEGGGGEGPSMQEPSCPRSTQNDAAGQLLQSQRPPHLGPQGQGVRPQSPSLGPSRDSPRTGTWSPRSGHQDKEVTV